MENQEVSQRLAELNLSTLQEDLTEIFDGMVRYFDQIGQSLPPSYFNTYRELQTLMDLAKKESRADLDQGSKRTDSTDCG
jgi:hypothetical protein